MATLSPTIFKAKVLKDGKHKIRIAVRHKHETCYIITKFIVEEKQFKNGQVIKRPDAAIITRNCVICLILTRTDWTRLSIQNYIPASSSKI